MLRTVMIGTISMQGYLLACLPHGYARVIAFGRVVTGKLVTAAASVSA